VCDIDKKYVKDMLKHKCDECVHFCWYYCEYGITDEQTDRTPYKPRTNPPLPKLRICPMFIEREKDEFNL
jgi:hypothetical protein